MDQSIQSYLKPELDEASKVLWDRLKRRVKVTPSGCWEWQGHRTFGYGRIQVGNKCKRAHRVSYQLLVGDIPAGKELDHLCRNRACINPSHLEPVTGSENVRRGAHGMKTHCPWGHEYNEKNTYLSEGKWRSCRKCNSRTGRRERAKLRSVALGGSFGSADQDARRD